MICKVCNEKVISDSWTGLCYLHTKYVQRLTGPYFETLYDLVYWKATFLKEWDRLGYGKISMACSPHVEVHKMNPDTLADVRQQVTAAILNPKRDLSTYLPLLRKVAKRFSTTSSFGFKEIFNQGALILEVLSHKIGPAAHVKGISTWVRRSLTGEMLKFVTRYNSVIKNPRVDEWTEGLIDMTTFEDEWQGDPSPSATELMVSKELKNNEGQALADLVPKLNPSQRRVMVNMLRDKPRTQKQLAKAFGVSQSKISKDTKVIFKKAKELGYGN